MVKVEKSKQPLLWLMRWRMRWLMGAVLAGWLIMPVSASAADASQQSLQKAEAALQQQDFKTTIELLAPLHQADPTDLTIGNNLAVAYLRQQRYQQAQQVLETVLNSQPQLATVRQNLKQIYAYQAQLAYQTIFRSDTITPPTGQWILSADYEIDTTEVSALKQVQLDIAQVTQQLEIWRSAWSAQDLTGYLGSYQSEYYDEGFKNRQAWVENRQLSVTNPRFIRVQLTEITVVPLAKNIIQVQFWQRYESNRFKDKVRKKLLWQKQQDGAWKIMQESVIYE